MLATDIRKYINKIPEGKTFGYLDIGIAREKYLTAAKALERFQKEGLIKRVSKGVFYKPKLSVFGELEPEYNELLQAYLFENGKRIAYITGTSLYNQLGLTTQMAFKIKIASRKKRIYINRGALKAGAVKSYAEITEGNIKKIPDCSIAQAVRRLQAIVRSLDEKQTDELLRYAIMYPPRVRALVGAILESLGKKNQRLDKLKNSLNPLSTFELGIKEKELPTKSNWYIG
jgi:hypothetical protein